jgi:hypothetical protein
MKVPAGMDTNCIAWPSLCWRFYNEFANRASPAISGISGSTRFTMQSRSGTTFSSGAGLTKNEYRGGRTEGVGPRLGSAQRFQMIHNMTASRQHHIGECIKVAVKRARTQIGAGMAEQETKAFCTSRSESDAAAKPSMRRGRGCECAIASTLVLSSSRRLSPKRLPQLGSPARALASLLLPKDLFHQSTSCWKLFPLWNSPSAARSSVSVFNKIFPPVRRKGVL